MKPTTQAVPPNAPTPETPADPALQGEGNYTATRRHRESLKEFIDSGQVEQAARDAEPDNARDAREMQEAEEAGRARAKK